MILNTLIDGVWSIFLFLETNTHIKGNENENLIQKYTTNGQTSLKNLENLKKKKRKRKVKQDILHPKVTNNYLLEFWISKIQTTSLLWSYNYHCSIADWVGVDCCVFVSLNFSLKKY